MTEQNDSQKHYELTGETKIAPNGETMHRIRATKDMPHHWVRAGDVGGWIGEEIAFLDGAWIADEGLRQRTHHLQCTRYWFCNSMRIRRSWRRGRDFPPRLSSRQCQDSRQGTSDRLRHRRGRGVRHGQGFGVRGGKGFRQCIIERLRARVWTSCDEGFLTVFFENKLLLNAHALTVEAFLVIVILVVAVHIVALTVGEPSSS